jgi:hypothetical protein
MFENLKTHFMSLWTKPVAFVEDHPKLMDDDYWAFEMVTHEWIDECGVVHPIKETIIIEPHETTWMEVLDRILDEMSKHYGYSIKDRCTTQLSSLSMKSMSTLVSPSLVMDEASTIRYFSSSYWPSLKCTKLTLKRSSH